MGKYPKIAFIIATIVILSLFTFIDIQAKTKTSSTYIPSPYDLVNEVNLLRASNGLSPYIINQTLMIVAQAHSDYQASVGSVTHYGSDGSRPFQRALAAGYPLAGDLSQGGFFSENITSGRNLTVAAAVLSWQQDAPHLNTMLSSIHQDIGAGVSVVGETIYYTIDVGLSTEYQDSSTPGTSADNNSNPNVYINPIITSTPDSSGSIIHTVKLGETIWVISQIYQVPENEIIKMNNLPNNLIFVGDQLLIKINPTKTSIPPTQTITNTPSMTAKPTISISPTAVDYIPNSSMVDENKFDSTWLITIPIVIFLGIALFAIFRIRINQ